MPLFVTFTKAKRLGPLHSYFLKAKNICTLFYRVILGLVPEAFVAFKNDPGEFSIGHYRPISTKLSHKLKIPTKKISLAAQRTLKKTKE